MTERNEIQTGLTAIRPAKINDVYRAAELLENFAEIWQLATDAERQELLHVIIETDWVKDGIIVALEDPALPCMICCS